MLHKYVSTIDARGVFGQQININNNNNNNNNNNKYECDTT